jgi:IS5 family transposase
MLRHSRRCAIALKREEFGKAVLHDLNSELEKAGITARGGSIVDATFIEAPSPTKNHDHTRDP